MPSAAQAKRFNGISQREALAELARIARESIADADIHLCARQIVSGCPDRDYLAELNAVYSAVKYGNLSVPGLERGIRYVADPILFDSFTSPARLLKNCKQGANGGDCDDQAAFVACLCASLGFPSCLVGYSENTDPESDLTHVFASVGCPKDKPTQWLGMDTTYRPGRVGWVPPGGRFIHVPVSSEELPQ